MISENFYVSDVYMNKCFGERLVLLRTGNAQSQKQLADALSVDCRTIDKWERGKSKPGYDAILNIALHFKTSPNEIMGCRGSFVPSAVDCPPGSIIPSTDEWNLFTMFRELRAPRRNDILRYTESNLNAQRVENNQPANHLFTHDDDKKSKEGIS